MDGGMLDVARAESRRSRERVAHCSRYDSNRYCRKLKIMRQVDVGAHMTLTSPYWKIECNNYDRIIVESFSHRVII